MNLLLALAKAAPRGGLRGTGVLPAQRTAMGSGRMQPLHPDWSVPAVLFCCGGRLQGYLTACRGLGSFHWRLIQPKGAELYSETPTMCSRCSWRTSHL